MKARWIFQRAFVLIARLIKMNTPYEIPTLSNEKVVLTALSIIKNHLDNIPVGQACRVLQQTELLLKATMMVDCYGEEFQKADEGFQVYFSQLN
ncbi:hypothetical protein IOV19_001396 [Salmonella enterica]|nr:hypothetical protein [Salmonella enterica]